MIIQHHPVEYRVAAYLGIPSLTPVTSRPFCFFNIYLTKLYFSRGQLTNCSCYDDDGKRLKWVRKQFFFLVPIVAGAVRCVSVCDCFSLVVCVVFAIVTDVCLIRKCCFCVRFGYKSIAEGVYLDAAKVSEFINLDLVG